MSRQVKYNQEIDGILSIKNEYAFPAADGSAGQVLTTDGAGAVTFEDPKLGLINNLIVTNGSGSGGAVDVDIDADYAFVANSSGIIKQLQSINVTIDIETSGANGLDTGTEAVDTLYYIWLIYNPTTDTIAGLASLSPSSPTMPSGYTYKYLVSSAITDFELAGFYGFRQFMNEYFYDYRQQIATGLNSNTYTAQDISGLVPTSSGKVGSVLLGATNTTSDSYIYLSVDSNSSSTHTTFISSFTNNASNQRNSLYSVDGASPDFVPVIGDNIYYRKDDTNANTTLYARAFKWTHL